MLITIFTVLIALSLLIVIIGFWKKNDVMKLTGFLLMFLLSFTLIGNNLEYQTGYNSTTNYTYNEMSKNGTLLSESTITNFNYSSYEGTKTYGIYLVILSILGWVSVFLLRGKL